MKLLAPPTLQIGVSIRQCRNTVLDEAVFHGKPEYKPQSGKIKAPSVAPSSIISTFVFLFFFLIFKLVFRKRKFPCSSRCFVNL